jgi:hypothetical protein
MVALFLFLKGMTGALAPSNTECAARVLLPPIGIDEINSLP